MEEQKEEKKEEKKTIAQCRGLVLISKYQYGSKDRKLYRSGKKHFSKEDMRKLKKRLREKNDDHWVY